MDTNGVIKVTTTVGAGRTVEDTEYDTYIIRKITATSELDGTTFEIETVIDKGVK